MKVSLLLVVGFILGSCGKRPHHYYDRRSQSCTVSQDGVLSCPDGTEYQIPPGPPGTNGQDGKDGQNGAAGQDGKDGIAGKDGESCTVTQMSNGAVIECAETQAIILNGQDGAAGAAGRDGIDGQDGQDGTNGQDGAAGQNAPPTAYTVVEIINPCGVNGLYDEVLFRLANNQIVAHFASGSRQFLTIIGPGSYITTDGYNCRFTVHSDLSVSW